MKVVSFTIFKGGTGKTTSSVNTAVALLRRKKRVLLVDLDQQASATRYLGIDPESTPSLYQVFMNTRSIASAVRKTAAGVDMLTANSYLAAIEEALEPGDELKLSALLTPLRAEYDFIILDSPPGKARLNYNALAASDIIIITSAAERMALDGVADTIGHIQRHLWGKYPELEHQELRILFTMYRATTNHAPAVVASAQKIWRDNILGVRIPHAAIFAQSYDQKQSVFDISPRHPGALAYEALADLLLPYENT
jgi:chromosome partitioning protein